MLSSKAFLSYIALATVVCAAPVLNERAISVGIIGNEAIVEGFNEDLMHKTSRRSGIYAGIIGNEAIVEGFNEDLIRKKRQHVGIIGNEAIVEGFNEDLIRKE
ncbi:uncharacterized protein Bfra_006108 [Botrytis fragariae]|uniref:Uncharacterized protein n=1 Tax=Botrytis fragariae TaxID=1964551 RepID=A0A8H6EI51_9HELO|nr:uncharacterized protein Bfra_006108 [Botrytis fragariae]KAF5872745.1 hypothetical protein Bfra_006108 [Botrytis fragariae]